MSTTTRNRTLRSVVVAAVIVVIGIAAAITATLMRGDSDPASSGSDAEFGIDPAPTEPVDVAVHVMSGLYTWQPAVQDSSWDALHSQQQYLTGTLAQAAAQPPSPAPQPISEWSAWARSADTITAVVVPAGDPDVGGDTATVPVTITQTVQHRHGDATPYYRYTATVELSDTDGGWKVSNYRLGDAVR